jgi:hypothetical protein
LSFGDKAIEAVLWPATWPMKRLPFPLAVVWFLPWVPVVFLVAACTALRKPAYVEDVGSSRLETLIAFGMLLSPSIALALLVWLIAYM